MEFRMVNTFTGLIKNKTISEILAKITYKILCLIYWVIRFFLRKKPLQSKDNARKNMQSVSKKPEMKCRPNNKNADKDLSVIVPAYNAERTIAQCLESVISQETNYDYELIIVNDGSTDRTMQIVEQYKNPHIVLINQENRGFSGARNRGIDESVGKYLMFLDSDDYLVGNCIESMMNNALNNNSDIVQASCFSFFDGSSAKNYSVLQDDVIKDDTEKMIRNPGFPWAKLYKRELFHNLRFPLDVWFEDTIVCMLLFRMCKTVSVMSEVVYAYRINPEGITKKARHSKKCVDHYWVMEYCLDKAKELGLPGDKLQYEMVVSHMSTLLYRRISLMDNEVIESAFVLAADMLDNIRPKGYECTGNFIQRDIEKAFITGNYKLWKLASFVV